MLIYIYTAASALFIGRPVVVRNVIPSDAKAQLGETRRPLTCFYPGEGGMLRGLRMETFLRESNPLHC